MSVRREAGSILMETAITVSLCLSLLIFSIDVGVLGFLQETSDAASFVYAHGSSVGVSNAGGVAAAVHSVFPQVPVTAVTGAPSAAPVVTIPVNYGYNGTPAQQLAASTNRHGGESVIQPQSYIATVSMPSVTQLKGFTIGTAAQESEGYARECGEHFDVAGSTAQCGDAADPANFNINFLTSGENVAPYYVGFNYMWQCQHAEPWGAIGCPAGSSETMDSIAVASQLFEHQNLFTPAANTKNSQSDGTENLTLPDTTGFAGSGNPYEGAFNAVACVERDYAWLSLWLNQYPTLGDLYRNWFTQAANPTTGIYTGDAASSNEVATHNGIYFYWKSGYSYDSRYYWSYYTFDWATSTSIDMLYFRDTFNLTSGYSTGSSSQPGAFPLTNRLSCGNAPPFPYSY